MKGRRHILIAKPNAWHNRHGLTDWQFGALMTDVLKQHSSGAVRQPTNDERREFDDPLLFDQFHWSITLDENAGFTAKMILESGIEFYCWTDKEMDPIARAVAENPEHYKLSMDIDLKGTKLRSLGFRSSKSMADGRKIIFCYSTQRNIAGWFLSWRQIVDHSGRWRACDRDMIVAFKLRREATKLARTRASES